MALNVVPSSADVAKEDDESEDGEEEGLSTGGPAAKAVGSVALCQGWRIAKKAAIAGAALTSAPLVIPPYCIFSTISLALSVPFAVYLASVTAAEKVLKSLLPPPPAVSEALIEELLEEQEGDFDEPMDRNAAATEDEERELEEKAEWKPTGESEESPTATSSLLAEAARADSEPALSTEYTSASEDSIEAKVDSVATTEMKKPQPRDEKIYSKEKIWEDICALRTITGYTALLHSSPVEELRALYFFTGVEPPLSLKDSSDTIQIDEKVQFLKLVIGVQ